MRVAWGEFECLGEQFVDTSFRPKKLKNKEGWAKGRNEYPEARED